ncbi:TPA: hypothetical protein RRU07_004705 [Klebsiella pneumoniae]|nr:hypothetical protein [Klebsiella pneumoniae]HDZ0522355.1 hypothetical protein [Klebsiella pneumoniae]HDZ0947052.1 hypothetical protein [Klebsiella pneumoniae]
MDIDQVIRDLISQGMNSVWVYQTANSYGKEMVQLLDSQGNELAWRWLSDSCAAWQAPDSAIGGYSGLPTGSNEYDLSQGFEHASFTLGTEDCANYSELPLRPDWCR